MGNIQTSPVAPGIRLHLDRQYFTHVVQLAARDERRANFSLSRVKPDHVEIALPGAHSDIGGSYLAEAEECVMVGPMQGLTVSLNTDVNSTSIYRAAQQLKAQWVAERWPAEHLSIVTPPALVLPLDPKNLLGVREKRVRFKDIDGGHPQFSISAELQPLSDRLVAGDYSLLPEEDALLKRRYIHTSSNWNNPLGKATGRGIALIYINAPTPDGVRVQHPHVPDYDWTI